ncbi:hypothetical protein ACCO45_009450 [Purpureocillium lilacinum]|uniref:Uncharacterized protein n=1 Tax=Purpureocillium lilacinum TaxID=33203 RepID=A0ACC4DL59_PURLI
MHLDTVAQYCCVLWHHCAPAATTGSPPQPHSPTHTSCPKDPCTEAEDAEVEVAVSAAERGGGRGGAHGPGGDKAGGDKAAERPKKENILDLAKYMDKQITVKFNGGREVTGTLKGYDALMNLVLDDVKETLRDDQGNESSRSLGLVVARGTLLVVITPVDGSEVIANPFAQPDES